jgi:hypothetical protein
LRSGTLENAQAMAGHESPTITLDKIEQITI